MLSIGIVDGRNIRRTDLDAALTVQPPLADKRRGKLWLAPACSLLHTPLLLAQQTAPDPEIKSPLAFATEKLVELALLKDALAGNRGIPLRQRPDADQHYHATQLRH